MSERQTVLKWTRTSFLCFPFAAEFLSSLSSNALSDLWSDIIEEFLICANPQHGVCGGWVGGGGGGGGDALFSTSPPMRGILLGFLAGRKDAPLTPFT